MKKIITLIGLAALCAGCSNSSDSAKIDALSKEITLLEHNQAIAVTNEFVLYGEIERLNAEVTNLPTYDQLNSTMYFYHTNQVNLVSSFFQTENIATGFRNDVLFDQMTNLDGEISTIQDNLAVIDSRSTDPMQVEMESDIEQIQSDLNDQREDMLRIKMKLGIY